MIARITSDELPTDYCVTANAKLLGRISKRSRQIDVLIDLRHSTDNSRRVIVDAKTKVRKIDVKDVEAFRGLMEDVGATHGYLVCPSGFTRAAERRAQSAVSICLVPSDQLENFDPTSWPECKVSTCKGGRIFWDGYPSMTSRIRVLYDTPTSKRHLTFVNAVGKCERCGAFHVHCFTCGDVFHTPEDVDADYGHQCSCQPPWFWLASVEEDGEGHESAELHLVFLPSGAVITTDRRPLA
jgi:hypothetical protein